MSMRLKRLLVGVVAALPTVLLTGEASAECINVGVSVEGNPSGANTGCTVAVSPTVTVSPTVSP